MKRLGFAAFVVAVMMAAGQADEPEPHDIPKLSRITVDGDFIDWADNGFRVPIMPQARGTMRPALDFDPSFRVGWDREGLLFLFEVTDDVLVPSSASDGDDGRDMVLLGLPAGGKRALVTSVLGPDPADVRGLVDGVQTESAITNGGYLVEARVPWPKFEKAGFSPAKDGGFGFSVQIVDYDEPNDRASTDVVVYAARLGDTAGAPIEAVVKPDYRKDRLYLDVTAVAGAAGGDVTIQEGGASVAAGMLRLSRGRSACAVRVPLRPRGHGYDPLTVSIDVRKLDTVDVADVDLLRARDFMQEKLNTPYSVLPHSVTPPFDFERPFLAERWLGGYTVVTRCYDADYNLVAKPETPGRYGVVIDVVPQEGRPLRRYRTIYRTPDFPQFFQWWAPGLESTIDLPKELGIAPEAIVRQRRPVGQLLNRLMLTEHVQDRMVAPLLAGLAETEPGGDEASVYEDVWAADRQWWVGLKRKLNGFNEKYPEPFECPRPVTGRPTPVLRDGTEKEAGMKPGAVDAIDKVLKAWAAESDEAFAVCIARHGFVFLHQAYGERDGQPMTVDTPSWMASITKLMSATLMMMFVDQGLVGLDDPIDKHLPAFEGIEVDTPLTVRRLYNHTNGFEGHWGEDMPDLEQVISEYYPYLPVGKRHRYNGVGYALGGKIMEMMSGEAIPQLAWRHMLEPLGCTDTAFIDTYGSTMSVPLDMAKFGQMLLNKGAYGAYRFFSEETFEQILPVPIDIENGNGKPEWGMGTVWMAHNGLGQGTFGHGAASAATLRIDPVNGLVVVMTRNRAGANFDKYFPHFIEAITGNIAK